MLHICCAPDEAFVIQLLIEQFNLHCFFCNPNITPLYEYQKRLDEAARLAAHYAIPFEAAPYAPQDWYQAIQGLEDSAEGAGRCHACFMLRLRTTAQFCKKTGYDQFTTVMSVSPHKRISMLNECGLAAATESGIRYVPFDFKKNDGFKKSIQLSKDLNIYRQDYCGCILSLHERDLRKRNNHATD